MLVLGVTDALAELRPVAAGRADGSAENETAPAAPRPKRARAGTRTTTRRAAPA
jgi:hypothetical protein